MVRSPLPCANRMKRSGWPPTTSMSSVCWIPTRPGTNYIVTPVVGLVSSEFEPTLDDFEVAEVFEVPLDHVLDSTNFIRETRDVGEFTRIFYAIYYEEWRIWGATAGMLLDLVERMGRE